MPNVYSSPFIHKTLVVLGLACCLFLNPTAVQSANIIQSTATDSVKVQWTANSESDLAGYIVYQGTTSGSYSIYFDVGNTTVYEPQSLEAGLTYYFAVTAYDADGNESSPSTEVSVQVLAPTIPTLSFPELTSPAPGATLRSARETFSWTANTVSVTEWWLYVGTSKGALDIYDSGYLGMTSSSTVKELPTDGSTLYVRLWYKEGGRWKFIDTTYTAHTGTILPELTSPAPGATLKSARETFSWTANTVSVTEWWLYVGTSKGALDIYDSGYLGMTSSSTVKELPTDGSTLYVRLWYKEGGSWKFIDTTYTAHTGTILPELTSPAPGATLRSARETFSWTANTVSVTEWWLYVGTSKGALDIYDSGYLGMTSSSTVKELPTDGSTLYVRLWYKEGGSWKFIDTTYTAQAGSALPS